MAEAILSFAVENIGKLIIEEGNFLQGISKEVTLLHDDLRWIQMFLKYAGTKQIAMDTIEQWVPVFKAVAYEASGLAEDYTLRVSISSNKGFINTLKRIACIATECRVRHHLGVEIQNLRTRISNLTKNFGGYGHIMPRMEEGGSSVSSKQQQLRRTYSFVPEEDEVGLYNNDVEVLVEYLLNEGESIEHKISVVSIVGMGGIGKTTLAGKVYHHERLKSYFEGFAWVCVSQQWQLKDLLQGILCKLTPGNREEIMKSNENDLVRQLQDHLQAKRCLIVLDDIWSKEAWNCLKHAIPTSEQGSKILLTTRKKDVAEHDQNVYHHQVQFLDIQQSWKLLRKKLLRERSGRDCEDLDEMEDLGKKILENCGGLPLAVVALGGILRNRKTHSEWNAVHENIKFYMDRGEKIGEQAEVPTVLAYSYYDLPWQLKPCFLYLGKFREDSDIEVEILYQMWIGEGMIFEDDRMGQEPMMDVAERYLEELAKRCMVDIKVHEEGKHTITRLKSCRLHDLMRDLCLAKAKEENLYRLVDRITPPNSPPIIEAAQYGLVLRLLPHDISEYHFPPKEQSKHLRSFLCDPLVDDWEYVSGVRIMSQVSNLKMLRVLAILGSHMASRGCFRKSPLRYVGNLIHLRCLRLMCHHINLPYSLGNLKYLETLDLSGSECRIPNVLWKLGRLRYLYLPNLGHSHPKLQLSKQLEILELFDNRFCYPEDVCKLSNLRAFRAKVYENLEDLELIINHISNWDCMRICSLRIERCDFGQIDPNSSSSNRRGLAILSGVLFSRNIHELEIWHRLCRKLPDYPSHIPDPAGLNELKLWWTEVEEDPMGTLERLPNLRALELGPDSFVGQEMICHSTGFPQLKRLRLYRLRNLMHWKVDKGAMPKLSRLSIGDCRKLEMIPDGLIFLTSLQEISLSEMPEEFYNRVRRENGQQGEDYDKISHVPSVNIGWLNVRGRT